MDMKNEQLLDNAISETLGMNTAGESAAYERALAGDAGARATDRQLRETTAYLAAASPHMAPPADLRGRILLATAAKTYKLEDYRKASGEDNRFYKWGFYAAAASVNKRWATYGIFVEILRAQGKLQEQAEPKEVQSAN